MTAFDQCILPPDSLVTRTADTVDAEAIDWLWEGFIARSFLNLLVGETAAGKSTMLADIVARLTRGRALPGEQGDNGDEPVRAPGRVLWLGSEDPMELLTVPRLMACGADPQHGDRNPRRHSARRAPSFSLQDDLNLVGTKLVQGMNEGRPYVAFVIDPITSYLQGTRVVRKVDMNDSGQLRSVLEPWLPLTKYANCAMIGVTHLAKDTTRSMLHRVLGGGAFAQLCRSLPAVVNLPDEGPFEKALLQVKTNLPGVSHGAWRFRTNTKQVAIDKRNGRPVIASFPEWDCLDPAITPHSMAGGTRGPVPQRRADVFAPWLAALFSTAPTPDSELPIGYVRQQAIAAGVVGRSQKAWDAAADRHLLRRNHGGRVALQTEGCIVNPAQVGIVVKLGSSGESGGHFPHLTHFTTLLSFPLRVPARWASLHRQQHPQCFCLHLWDAIEFTSACAQGVDGALGTVPSSRGAGAIEAAPQLAHRSRK